MLENQIAHLETPQNKVLLQTEVVILLKVEIRVRPPLRENDR